MQLINATLIKHQERQRESRKEREQRGGEEDEGTASKVSNTLCSASSTRRWFSNKLIYIQLHVPAVRSWQAQAKTWGGDVTSECSQHTAQSEALLLNFTLESEVNKTRENATWCLKERRYAMMSSPATKRQTSAVLVLSAIYLRLL